MTATTTATESKGLRWGAWALVAFAVLLIVGLFFLDTPDGDASVSEWQSYMEDSGNRWMIIIHGYAWALAALSLLVFLSGVRERLRAVAGWTGTLAYLTGFAFAAMLMVTSAAQSTVASALQFVDAPIEAAGEFARYLEWFGFTALVLPGVLTAGVFIVATAAALGRAGLAPRWLTVAGYVAGVIVFILGVFFLPLVLLVLWALVTGIVLVRSSRTASAV